MTDASRPTGGPMCPPVSVAHLRDILARVVAAGEELAHDPCQAAAVLADLEHDVAALIEGSG